MTTNRRDTTIVRHIYVQKMCEELIEDGVSAQKAFEHIGEQTGYAPRTVQDIYYDQEIYQERLNSEK